jgi:two-component system NtrC family sensor kinase
MTGPRGERRTILLVEDSDTQALHMQLTLEAEGYQVHRVASAEDGLSAIMDELPDLVIADFHLPGMNGDELVRQIRLNVATRNLPVLMLTEARGSELERQGLESGADAYVPKSSGPELIVLRIKALLRQTSSVGDLRAERSRASASLRARLLLLRDEQARPLGLDQLIRIEGAELCIIEDGDVDLAFDMARSSSWTAVIIQMSDVDRVLDLCRRLETLRSDEAEGTDSEHDFLRIVVGDASAPTWRAFVVESFAAGADDAISQSIDTELLRLRIRSLVNRALVEADNRRMMREERERELAIERARADALAAEAKAAMAEALASANQELAAANRELKDTQAQLVHAAKMASLGELVAGIAHEINNPLAFILAHQGTVERLSREIEQGIGQVPPEQIASKAAKIAERLSAMREGLSRIQDLVRNLRSFSRLEGGAFEPINVPEALSVIRTLLGPKLGRRIQIEMDLKGPETLICSPALFNQAVMNIVSNAADALDEGGRITIRTSADDELYRFDIIDTGPGIDPALADRIFEPFFTTKSAGAGTGLGLSIAYRVVQAHQGEIEVISEEGQGAHFALKIPLKINHSH